MFFNKGWGFFKSLIFFKNLIFVMIVIILYQALLTLLITTKYNAFILCVELCLFFFLVIRVIWHK